MLKNIIFALALGAFVAGCSVKRTVYPGPTFVVEGTAHFEKNETIGNTTFWNIFTTDRPIPHARIAVLDGSDSNRVVVVGQTDELGSFKIQVPLSLKGHALLVRIYTESPDLNVPLQITDHNHEFGSKPYHVDSPIFTDSTTSLSVLAEGHLAGAFNIYATTQIGFQFVKEKAGEAEFPALRVHWEPNESGNGCTCFTPGSLIFPHEINIQDSPSNRNEFDDSVILHELGHYMHKAFSINDSPGGPHIVSSGQNQNLDPRLSWSEGWATGFSQMVLNRRFYIDGGPAGGFLLDIEYPFPVHQGPNSELTIAAMYLDLYDSTQSIDNDTISLQFRDIWEAMKAISRPHPNLKDFYQALLAGGKITETQWNANFSSLGLNTTAIAALP